MATISKFLFETEFDASGAERPRGAKPTRPDARSFTAADLESARSESYAAGVASGRADAEKQINRRIADALDALGTRLGDLLAEGTRNHEAASREAIVAATEIVKRLMPALAQREALSEVESLIGDCLSRLHDEPRLVIRVGDELLDPLRQNIDQLAAAAGFSGRVILLADAAMRATDARVEWADGGADRDLAAIWREVESAIQRFVGDGSGSPAAVRK